MKNNFEYPSAYELEEIFADIADTKFLNEFAQRKGLFVTNKRQADLARELSSLYYDEEDLELIRKEAYQINSRHSLTGFVIKSSEKDFSLFDSYNWMIGRGNFEKGKILNSLVKVPTADSKEVYRGSLEYTKSKTGRIQFLQNEVGYFDFYMSEQRKGVWKVEIDGNKSTDLKDLKDILIKNTHNQVSVESIDLDLLRTESTIIFFDELAKKGLGSEWEFVDTKNLNIKLLLNSKESEDNENNEETIATEAELEGITEAILHGKNLRTEPFVEDLIKKGFGFTAMTYEFRHKKRPNIIEVRAEFKGRPKVFEVMVPSYYEITGLSENREEIILNNSENRGYRSLLWNHAKEIFDKHCIKV